MKSCAMRTSASYTERVAVRMVALEHLADDTGALAVLLARVESHLAHRVEDAALHGLEAVAHVGKRARGDDRHRIREIALPHLVFDVDLCYDIVVQYFTCNSSTDTVTTLPTEERLRAFAAAFARRLRPGDVVALSGPLGAGKTTFVRAIVRTLHGADQSSSPTFTFRHRYDGDAADRPYRLLSGSTIRARWPNSVSKRRSTAARSCWWSGGATRRTHPGAPVRSRNRRCRRRTAHRFYFAKRDESSCSGRRARRLLGGDRARRPRARRAAASPGNVALERGLAIVEAVLARAALRRRAIDRLAVGVGPGGFTGLRIAVAYAKVARRGLGAAARADFVVRYAGVRRALRARAHRRRRAAGGDLGTVPRARDERRASGRIADVLDELFAPRLPSRRVEALDVVGAPEDVLDALAERGIVVHSVDPAVTPAAAAAALAAAHAHAAESLHEVRADYGELPAAKSAEVRRFA